MEARRTTRAHWNDDGDVNTRNCSRDVTEFLHLSNKKCLETMTPPDLTHITSIAGYVAIGLETPKINNRRSSKKEFTKLIYINI